MPSRIIKILYHSIVYTVGILVLAAAVSVTLIRLALPDIGEYRSEVEAWVSQYMGFPVVFHTIDATWQGWVPQLDLADINLLNKAGTKPITHFDRVYISIAPISTLLERKIIPKSIMISGMELSVSHLRNGAINIGGLDLEGMETGQTGKNELAEWLFKQDKIEIQDASVEWKDIKNQQEPVLLTHVSLLLRNDTGRFQADGSTTLPAEYGTKMDFAFDAFGDLLTSQWSGELYLAASDINPDNWYKNHRFRNFRTAGGKANITVWSSWQQAKLDKINGQLQYNNFETLAGKNSLHIEKLTSRFAGKRNGHDGWHLHVGIDNLITENGVWPNTELLINAEPLEDNKNYRYTVNFDHLELADLAPIFATEDFLPDKAKNTLKEISINGELNNGSLIIDPGKQPAERFFYDASFDHLTTDNSTQLPAFTNLSGRLYGGLTHGVVSLDTKSAGFHLPPIDKKNITLSQLTGDINWSSNDMGWQLDSGLVTVKTPDFLARISGKISKEKDNVSPFLDLIMSMDKVDLEKLPDYLPLSPRFRLRKWMRKAILAGNLESTTAVLRGHLDDFPFDENNGRFRLVGNVVDTTLDYSRFWPPVDQIGGEIIFDGRTMRGNFNRGKIFDADITTATTYIGDILKKEKTVMVEGHVGGNTRDLSLFIDQSPLEKDLALHEFGNAMKTGGFDLELKLGIPLKQKNKKADVEGTIQFTGLSLQSSINDLHLDSLTGNVAFTRELISSETLTANYLSHPVDVTVSGSKTDKENPPTISISGLADKAFITDRLIHYVPSLSSIKQHLLERISGETPWQVKLAYFRDNEQSVLNKHIDITSDLTGLEIDLPAPIGKTRESTSAITISTDLSPEQREVIDIQYGSVFTCILELDKHQRKKLQAANLHFGKSGGGTSGGHGIYINGDIDTLPVSKWMQVLKQVSDHNQHAETDSMSNDVDVNLQLSSLQLFNREFQDVQVLAHNTGTNWQFSLDSEDIKGDIILPEELDRDTQIDINLEKLHIKQNEEESAGKQREKLDPLDMPALAVHVQDFIYKDHELGEMQLRSTPIADGVSIDQLDFSKPALNIKGTGKWLASNDRGQSSFDIELNADYMDAMLETFGYNLTAVKKGKTNLQISANWPGSPIDFSLVKLNGIINMKIDNGQFLDINPKAGRLFGLLSIQTLPRRLSMDFTDIFGKGLAFDKIEGDFEISEGNAYTNNLYMRGSSANVGITGRAGLSDQDYDQIVTVTPQVSNSLPVASALFGPIGAGVGAVLYLGGKVFKSINRNINKLLSYQYTITGNWDDPLIEKIKNKEKVAGS
ncbi:MAG: YhdP family protein [Gammaproteobacteria bacterium]